MRFLAVALARLAVAATWTTLSPLPHGTLQEHITLPISSTQLVTLGGLVSNGSTTTLSLLYNIPTDKWTIMTPSLPIALNHPNAAVASGKIYLLGGLTGVSSWRATADCFVFDIASQTWSPLTAMPASEARGSAASVAYNNTIYLAGGITSSGGRTVDTVSAYHISSNTWISNSLPEVARRLPEARDHAGYAIVGSKFYVLGGRANGATAVKDTVFILDLADLQKGWRAVEMKMPTARGGLVAAAVGEKIYTFGGEGNPAAGKRGVFEQVEVFDTATEKWESVGAMKLPRHGTSAVTVDGKVYIPGGAVVQGMGGTEAFDVFSP